MIGTSWTTTATAIAAVVICTFLTLPGAVQSARILCVFPSPSRSHVLVGQALLKGLAERGHEVTMVSPFKIPDPVANYREVVIPVDDYTSKMTKDFLEKPPNIITTLPVMMINMMETAKQMVNDPNFIALKNEQFDVVICGVFVADFILGFGPHFQAPTVVLWTAGLTKITADLVGNPRAISAVPHIMLGPQDSMVPVVARLKNFMVSCVENLIGLYSWYHQKTFYEDTFPQDQYPSYDDVRKNVSLLLLNTHFSHAGPRPYLQNVIEVGGLQIKSKPDPLPQDIQEWLDGAEHGAVYFCLGSNLKSKDLPVAKLQEFVKSLGKLKQRVLWKWEADTIPNQPANVMTKKWLPQDDILAHPNVVLFISHGGLGGMAEARYHGVPILGIPIFAEQSGNVGSVVREGWGLEVDYATLNEKRLSKKLKQILTDPTYRQRAKEISTVYRDRPQTAMDTACYWIEYVIRHKGAPQMHYQGAELNFFQNEMLDVIAIIFLAVYLVVKVLKLVFKGITKLLCRRQPKQKIN